MILLYSIIKNIKKPVRNDIPTAYNETMYNREIIPK